MAHEATHSLKHMLNAYPVPAAVQGKQRNRKTKTQYLPRMTLIKEMCP